MTSHLDRINDENIMAKILQKCKEISDQTQYVLKNKFAKNWLGICLHVIECIQNDSTSPLN